MAIDFSEVFDTVYALQAKIHELLRVVQLAKDAKVKVEELGDLPLTQTQMDELKAKYTALKDEISSIWRALP